MPRSFSRSNEIYELIKSFKYLSLSDVHRYARKWGLKDRSIERMLNKSMCPQWIVTVYNNKKQVTGYKYKKVIV